MFLNGLGVIEAEGCNKDGIHFMMLTVGKPRRTSDVEQAINAYNSGAEGGGISLVSFEGGLKVVTFERGHKFQVHPIHRTIQAANSAGNGAYWAWGSAEEGKKRKRVINELESDLVEAAIIPVAEKRASHGKENKDVEQQVNQPAANDFYSIEGILCIGMVPIRVWSDVQC